MNYRNIFLGTLGMIIVAAAGFWWWQRGANATSIGTALEASGVIEARRANLAPEVNGLVVEVFVEEGDWVEAGQPLVRLDDMLLVAQRDQIAASLRATQANLALLESGASEDQLDAARAGFAQAEANMQLAQAGLYALTAGARPENITAIHARLEQARSAYFEMQAGFTPEQVELVREMNNIANHNLSNARSRLGDLEDDDTVPTDVTVIFQNAVEEAKSAQELANWTDKAIANNNQPYSDHMGLARQIWELAQENLAIMEARYESYLDDERIPSIALEALDATRQEAEEFEAASRDAYDALNEGAAARQIGALWQEIVRLQTELEASSKFASATQTAVATASVESVLAQIEIAAAGRDLARANLFALERGAREAELDAARAQVEAAEAQLAAVDIQLGKFTVTAPWDGVVLGRSVEPGESVLPGTILLEIGRLDELELTVYLAEDEFGRVSPGQTAQVSVDTFSNRKFTGTVRRIADQAEFTPTNIQTKEDRTLLVYAVTLGVERSDHALKPGMIADVTFEGG